MAGPLRVKCSILTRYPHPVIASIRHIGIAVCWVNCNSARFFKLSWAIALASPLEEEYMPAVLNTCIRWLLVAEVLLKHPQTEDILVG